MHRRKIFVCLLLVALSGAVIGGVATRWWMTHHAPRADAVSLNTMRLQRMLKLDDAQAAKVRVLAERWLVTTEALALDDIEGRVRLRRQFLPELSKLLTPEQRARFETLVAPNRGTSEEP